MKIQKIKNYWDMEIIGNRRKRIKVEGRILRKKLMHNSNKRRVEGGKNLRNQ
jgi:hypothetical protein